MIKLSVPLLAALFIAGCGSGGSTQAAAQEEEESTPTPRGKPAQVRVMNLTSAPITARVAKIYSIEDIPPMEMSYSRPVSPGKTFALEVDSGGKTHKYDLKTEPGKFATLVVRKDGIAGFSSGDSMSSADGGAIDFVNLTERTVTFSAMGQSVPVEPMSSQSLKFGLGDVPVKLGSESAAVTLGKTQIWSVAAVDSPRGVTLQVTNLKGNGSAAGTGGPSPQ